MKYLILILLISFLAQSALASENIVVIVHADNPLTKISKQQLRDMFFKTSRQWVNGTEVRFFDRTDECSERETFLKKYIGRSPRQIEQHWIGAKLYRGDSAPTQIGPEDMTVSLVSRFTGGIGYISAKNLSRVQGIKVLEVTE